MTTQEENEIETRLARALIGFVERAAKEGVAPAEVEALPSAAQVLFRVLYPCA